MAKIGTFPFDKRPSCKTFSETNFFVVMTGKELIEDRPAGLRTRFDEQVSAVRLYNSYKNMTWHNITSFFILIGFDLFFILNGLVLFKLLPYLY